MATGISPQPLQLSRELPGSIRAGWLVIELPMSPNDFLRNSKKDFHDATAPETHTNIEFSKSEDMDLVHGAVINGWDVPRASATSSALRLN